MQVRFTLAVNTMKLLGTVSYTQSRSIRRFAYSSATKLSCIKLHVSAKTTANSTCIPVMVHNCARAADAGVLKLGRSRALS